MRKLSAEARRYLAIIEPTDPGAGSEDWLPDAICDELEERRLVVDLPQGVTRTALGDLALRLPVLP